MDGQGLWSQSPLALREGARPPAALCLHPWSGRGSGLPPTVPHLAGVNATLRVAGTEHLGLDLVRVEVGAVADLTADYGDSGLLEYPSLLAWGCAGKAGRGWGTGAAPFPPAAPPQALQRPWAPGPRSIAFPARLPFPSPVPSPSRRLCRQKTGLTVVLRVAPAGYGADLAVHQGLAGSREAHRLDVFWERDQAVQPLPACPAWNKASVQQPQGPRRTLSSVLLK